jgi:hypothetical protein
MIGDPDPYKLRSKYLVIHSSEKHHRLFLG